VKGARDISGYGGWREFMGEGEMRRAEVLDGEPQRGALYASDFMAQKRGISFCAKLRG